MLYRRFPLAYCVSSAFMIVVVAGSLAADANAQASEPSENLPPLETLSDDEFEVIRQFFDYETKIPLEARTVERRKREEDGTVREKIVFRSTQGFLVSGYLQYRRDTPSPRPCVLLMHGWSGSKDSWYERDNYISGSNVREALLEKGFATLALDAQCHGDRISENDFAPINHYVADGEENPRRGYFTQREIYVQTVLDYRRGLDYLATRDDIDSSRIGVVGYSMGGTESVILTAIDDRVRASVACAVPWDGERSSLIAPQHYAARISNSRMLMITGKEDGMCTQAQTRQIHSTIAAPDAQLIFVDGGHRMSSDYAPHAVAWIVEHL